MTFYNPNIQSHFEATLPDYPALKGKTFACINFVFSTPGIDGRQYDVSLNDQLLQNYLGTELCSLLSELVYRSWQGSIVTPADFIQKIKEIANENSTPDEFYLSHLMKMLVEKLLLDPNCPLNPGKVNLYEMIFSPPYPKKTQALFSLNERLQLIEYLINHLHFHPDAKQMQILEQNHYIKVVLRTK